MDARSATQLISRILARSATKQTRVLVLTRTGRGALGAFRCRNPSQYSRYCFGLPPRTASHSPSVAPARGSFRGSLEPRKVGKLFAACVNVHPAKLGAAAQRRHGLARIEQSV